MIGEKNMKDEEMNMKLEFFKKKKIKVHIVCSSGRFYNGSVFEIEFGKRFLVLMDNKLGEVPIMFEEIQQLEPMKDER